MGVLSESNVLCKCRVLYIGSAVPLETATGLDAIQLPLRERYPVDDEAEIEGIDAELCVTSHDLQLSYVNQSDTVIQFPISSLTLCAAVRCLVTVDGTTGERMPSFVSLTNSKVRNADPNRPAIFTAITRRSQGLKVLECHGFVCASPRDALDLVKAAATAGERLKRQGTASRSTITRPVRGFSARGEATQEARMSFRASSKGSPEGSPILNRTPSIEKPRMNGIVNGPSMRLIPGEPIGMNVAAGPEFFEPVSQQGYFYSSDKTEVRKYNITKLGGDAGVQPEPAIASTVPPVIGPTVPPQTRHIVNGGPILVGPPPPRPPVFVRHARQPPRPIFVGPPPPPPPPMFMRPRFFSPPPPRMRPMPGMMPPYGGPPPPPMYATPVFVRRRKPGSRSSSGSKSRSVTPTGSRGSRSKSPEAPIPNGINVPKNMPNGDAETSSNSSHDRPHSPPTDYDKRFKGKRQSRRDEYEGRNRDRNRTPTRQYTIPAPPPIYVGIERAPPPPPAPYDYYVYPPRHGGYAPFTMYNPHGRSRSVPPQARYRSKSPRRKEKKSKKTKKHRSRKHRDRRLYERQNMASDVSTDSYAGYQSEIPVRQRATSGYEFYPPRDFRRDENQFMNERNFSRSIIEESRNQPKPQPTAYELNEAFRQSKGPADEIEGDFTLY